MKTMISLGVATILTTSPFLELGTTIVNAQALRESQLSSHTTEENSQALKQDKDTASSEASKEESLGSTNGVADETMNQETETPLVETVETSSEEQSEQVVEIPKNEVTSIDESTGITVDTVIISDDTVNEEMNSLETQQESQTGLENSDSNQMTIFEAKNNITSTGTLEFDIYFPTPLSDSKGLNLSLKKDGQEVGNLSLEQSSGTEAKLNYTVEKLNSKREPLQDGEIYFIHVSLHDLEVGTYEAELSGVGYQKTVIPSIALDKYSKRVKLAVSSSEVNQISRINEEYPTAFLVGDVNQDGKISNEDYELVLGALGTNDENYDLNRDGIVDITDLSYTYGNISLNSQVTNIENTNMIVNLNDIQVESSNASIGENQDISDLFLDQSTTVNLSKTDHQAPSEESPLSVDMTFGSELDNQTVLMEQVVIKVPTTQTVNTDEVGIPEKGFVVYTDESGKEHKVPFDNSMARSTGDIVIDLGSQVAVKKISINVTGNRGNKVISQIAKVEFLNNVYKELPAPDMNIPVIKTVETSTNRHDERITLTWDAEPNVTSYEVTYEQLNEKTGEVVKTKKLQTNEPKINILDKDIKPYSLYRVKVQSLSGEWSSGYVTQESSPKSFDKKPDNVDENYNPIQDYYNGNIGSATEVQVIPIQSPDVPINLVTTPGFKSFSVTWEEHIQALDFDIYYRKVADENKKWIKANQDKIEVNETDAAVTNPDKDYLVRAKSYTVNGLEDNTTYEVRITATNHLGTSKMSDTYLASTENVTPPVMTGYNLINRPNENSLVGTDHIIEVIPGLQNGQSGVSYESVNAIVDGDFTTDWRIGGWEAGALNPRQWTPLVTFDDTYEIGTISFAKTLEKGYKDNLSSVRVTYWDEDDNEKSLHLEWANICSHQSNGHTYYTVILDNPIHAKKIRVATSGYVGADMQSFSEIKFYQYDSLEDDVEALFTDNLRIDLKDDVTQDQIDALVTRANTPDSVSGDYHPNQETILKELQLAQDLLNDQNISQEVITLDASIRDNGAAIGMSNAWQSLGAVARPSTDENDQQKTISVYMGSSDANTQVEISFLQAYGQPGQYISKSTVIKPGRTEITIPEIFTADVEKGGAVMAKVKSGSTDATIQIRLSNVEEIPHLNVNNLISDEANETEVKALIKDYINELTTYVADLPSKYPSSVTDEDKLNNVYLYDAQTSVLNWTDIEGDRFTLSVPATEILKGIQSGNLTLEQQVDRVYDALLAWEQEMLVTYAKKGVFESVQDFDGNGNIDSTDTQYYNKHKAPTTRLNVKYQRMIMGAAAYASSHHVGIGYGTVAGLIQGVPYKIDENGEVTNKDQAKLYGALIGHEIGHVVDTANRIYPETSNNLLADLTDSMLDEDAPQVNGALKALYQKVTSNTFGLSTNRSVVLGMLWQPHLAYDEESTYKMLLTNFDADLENDSYFAKLNRAYREMTAEEKANGDRDQWLIRLSSKVVGKDLTAFYEAHGIIANETTLAYVSKFEEETRPIQYINDEARRHRLAGTANMPADTQLVASFGDGITDRSYVNSKSVPFKLSVTTGSEHILGYEIIRNGEPAGFILRDKDNEVTNYEDVIANGNNRTYTYEVVAYDYNLNATNKVSLGTIKVRHDGVIASRDQWLIRLSSKVVGKDLTAFYEAHGIIANETTLAYVSKFEEETRPIQYINDEARRHRLAGTANMPADTQLVASFGDGITDRSYVNSKSVPFKLSVTTGSEHILGYEIIRNGEPAGFILRDKDNEVTNYEDVIANGNNRTYTYEVVAYDYNLNATNKVSLGTIKVRHDGVIASEIITPTSSTVDVLPENNDIHGSVANLGLVNMLDGDLSTVYNGRKLISGEYNSSIHGSILNPNVASYVVLDLNSVKSVIGLKYTAPVTEGLFKTKKLADNTVKRYKIDISDDGSSWKTINTGTFNVTAQNPTEMVYFAKDGVSAGSQLNTYQIRYVRLVAVGQSDIGIAELELVGPPGDNIEIGVSTDNQTYENGIGILSEDYIYQADNTETTDVNEEQKIPKGSIVITGEYRGNPAFNVPLVLNENEQHIADEYHGILLAEIPSDGKLEEIAKGTWIYWVEPAFVDQFKQNKSIFAELYRTDTANLATDGQRLVSNTFMFDIPEQLPSISFNKTKTSNYQLVKEITQEQITDLSR